jgi:hypothetical protein
MRLERNIIADNIGWTKLGQIEKLVKAIIVHSEKNDPGQTTKKRPSLSLSETCCWLG